jgi:hypothetical protein
MSPRLALGDNLAEQRLKSLHVIMLERSNAGTAESDTESDRRMVELVGDDHASFVDERREGC